MEEVMEFLKKKAGTYYLATDDNGQPRVRPFGTATLFEGRLYIFWTFCFLEKKERLYDKYRN